MQAIATVLACGGGAVAAGVYLNFSVRVMPSLDRLATADAGAGAGVGAATAIARMQRFNVTAVQWPFMSAFFGAALGSVYLVVAPPVMRDATLPAVLAGVGGALYLAGFLLTIAFHVPRNNALARLDPATADSTTKWAEYSRPWSAANTVRAVLSVASVVGILTAVGVAGVNESAG